MRHWANQSIRMEPRRIQPAKSMSSTNGFWPAVRARETYAGAHEGIDVWKYAFPLTANQPVEDLQVRCTAHWGEWTGIFGCARGRHVEVLMWPAANAVVVAAANALYIVDPNTPGQFNGLVAPVEINDVIFDEFARNMFAADSLRIYAFSSDRLLQWISEPLGGYGARFRGCGGRVLAVELKQDVPESVYEEAAPSVIRLRTEDGTILRSRFRLAHSYWLKSGAA
jgi:hypothetical protein